MEGLLLLTSELHLKRRSALFRQWLRIQARPMDPTGKGRERPQEVWMPGFYQRIWMASRRPATKGAREKTGALTAQEVWKDTLLWSLGWRATVRYGWGHLAGAFKEAASLSRLPMCELEGPHTFLSLNDSSFRFDPFPSCYADKKDVNVAFNTSIFQEMRSHLCARRYMTWLPSIKCIYGQKWWL